MVARARNSKNVLKVCILGEGGVGKTTLTKRIITGAFDSTTKMTIGVDFHLLKTSIFDPFASQYADDVPQIPIQAQIWDFAGEERFRFMLPRYCKGSVCGLLLYDITRYSTTNYIDEWFSIWKDNAPKGSPLLLVATKSDLIAPEREERAMETMIELAERLDIPNFYIISSLDGKNVHVLTNDLLISAYKFNFNYLKEQGF
ncbi:Rab family GTPase [Promethearchaeum syntrophicum]|uniref:Rab family GTPase n=1 Tax=Promethearchaeum syntrophicum TaxID=2594042 RepID=A0A5B9DB08_9ARCH|nr:Rab family GTPase [Candidatus Prometheoarchaeum syntrophicum]QEE16181.1 Ras family protein [Candidatus Prometheoarchaeum syntrophicum]